MGLRGGLVFVMFVLLVSSVFALGVSPGRTTIDFEPGLVRVVDFSVVTSSFDDLDVLLVAQGDLAPYISLPLSTVSVSSSRPASLSYSVNLPQSLEPGLHTGEVFIVEIPETDESDESTVLATLAVLTQLHVNVPYPGKFAEADLVVYDAAQGGDVQFVFPVLSRGRFDLTDVGASVDVYNSLGEKVDSFRTESIAIPGGERKELSHLWRADVPIGNYRVVASLIYDEGTIPLEAEFSVGSKDIELQEIVVNEFSLGEIVKLEMLVENKWVQNISDVFIKTRIRNDDGEVVSSFDSASYDVGALSKQAIDAFWDTAGVLPGDYQADVSVNYAGQSFDLNLEFLVGENDLEIIGLGYVISSGGDDGPSTLIIVLIVVIVLLILVNLLWFLLLRKRFKR